MVKLFLLIHVLLLLAIVYLRMISRLRLTLTTIPLVLFVPVWGSISVLLEYYLRKTHRIGTAAENLEVMKASLVNMDEMPTPEDEEGGSVPLQDALLIDNSQMKRSVILNVLMQDANSYVKVLNEARMNEDVEVVHYATTAMMELSKEYEFRIQKFAAMYADEPDNDELLTEYRNYIEQYVYSGMVEGQMLELHMNTYKQLLLDCIQRFDNKEDYFSLINCLFESGELAQVRSYLSKIEEKWRDDENVWLFKFRLAFETSDTDEMCSLINETKEEGRFFSKDIRKIAAFWEKKQ
ncbi:hypothetical protein SAMN06296386_104105 [Lachnospiraceae bacterium]|nr:hypothetical protein SAMN06296386_104105 [Lachnospiraceae bacterium]